jgi:hypothetical protein
LGPEPFNVRRVLPVSAWQPQQGSCVGAGAGMAGAVGVAAGALTAAGAAMGALGAACAGPPWNFITSGTMSKATMLMILISGLTAGPAVSL